VSKRKRERERRKHGTTNEERTLDDEGTRLARKKRECPKHLGDEEKKREMKTETEGGTRTARRGVVQKLSLFSLSLTRSLAVP